MNFRKILSFLAVIAAGSGLMLTGCQEASYSNSWLTPSDVSTVYVEMFENSTFRRGLEYTLSNAVAKRIEAETQYKIVSDKSRADTVLSGTLNRISETVLAGEYYTGRPLEKQATVSATVTWKNLKTGELLLEGERVTGAASYSKQQRQDYEYATTVAANRLAERIVEKMQVGW